jgi:hypothetical protein
MMKGLQITPSRVHSLTPGPQIPGSPLSQGCPPSGQVMPVMRNTLSSKSPSFMKLLAPVVPSSTAM